MDKNKKDSVHIYYRQDKQSQAGWYFAKIESPNLKFSPHSENAELDITLKPVYSKKPELYNERQYCKLTNKKNILSILRIILNQDIKMYDFNTFSFQGLKGLEGAMLRMHMKENHEIDGISIIPLEYQPFFKEYFKRS